MYSTVKALTPKLNCLDFLLLKGQSHDKVCLWKNCWLHDAVVFRNILQIRETGFTSKAPLFENHNF
jgi:hypothetical protein